MKIIWLSIILLFICAASDAQTILQGNVTDSSGQVLYPATVSLFRLPDSVIVKRAATRRDGFRMAVILPGDYFLLISFIGYRETSLLLHFTKKDSAFNIGKIQLAKKGGNLVEVVVKTVIPPVIVKRDTVVYNAAAYKTRPNATVEDLLKKLPGVEVDREGNITMQGKRVEKIYIDGKEFFLGDPRTASQNLTADMLQSIEAFDSQSDRSRFTGIKENNGTKAINLKLKKDRKRGFFGKVYAGTGAGGSYSAGGTVTGLQVDQMYFGNLNSNNINNLFTGNERNGAFPQAGQQTNTSFNLNYRDNWNKNLNSVVNYSATGHHSVQTQSSNLQTFFGDSSLLQNRQGSSSGTRTGQSLGARIMLSLDSMTSVIYTPNFSLQKTSSAQKDTLGTVSQKNSGSYLLNTGSTDNSANGNGYVLNNNIAWQQRFQKKGRFFYGNFSQGHSSQDQHGSLQTLTRFFDSAGNLLQQQNINQRSTQHTGADNYNLSLSYTEPLTKNHILDFEYAISASNSKSDKNSLDYDSLTRAFDLPDTVTTNHFRNTSTVHRVSVGYNTTGHALNYQLGIATQYSNLQSLNYTKSSDLQQRFVNWFPRVSIYYALSKSRNLNLSYNGSNSNPSIDELQPLPDLTNPLLIKVGNPFLKQEFDHSVSTSYTNFNASTLASFLVQLDGSLATNKIVPSNITLASGVQQLQYINVNGNYAVSSNISYGFPIDHSKHGNVKFNTTLGYAKDISFVNSAENIRRGLTAGENLDINYNYHEKFFIESRAGLNYNTSTYSIQQGGNTELLTQQYSFDCGYALPLSLNVSVSYMLQVTGKQGSLPGQHISVANASLYKTVFHNKAGEIRLSGFDLFNNKSNFSQSSGANFISTQSSNTIGRVFLLSFIYRFHHFFKAA